MAGDWLRLYRKSLDSRVFSDDWLWRLWCWCLMSTGWKTSWKNGREIMPGQFTLGIHEASERLGVSASKLYRGLQKLSDWGQIRLEAKNRYTIVTLCNWRTYQPEEYENGVERKVSEKLAESQRKAGEKLAESCASQPVIYQALASAKEGKEGKEGKEEYTPPTPPKPERGRAVDSLDILFDRFWKAYPKHDAKLDAQRAWDELQVDDALLEEMLKAIAAQKQTDKWKRGVIPNAGNWLRQQRWTDKGIVTPDDAETPEQRAARQQKEREARQVKGQAVPLGDVVRRAQQNQQRKVNDDPTSGS